MSKTNKGNKKEVNKKEVTKKEVTKKEIRERSNRSSVTSTKKLETLMKELEEATSTLQALQITYGNMEKRILATYRYFKRYPIYRRKTVLEQLQKMMKPNVAVPK